MIDNPYLDTIIALVLIYALLSILVSILLEAWNKRTKERGVFLQRVVLRLLNDPLNRNFGYLIYQHPIINKMRKDGNSYPHYISAEAFANALIDTLAEGAVEVSYVDGPDGNYVKQVTGENDPLAVRLMNGVARLNDSEFKRLMTNFLQRNTTPTVAGMIGTHGSPDLDKLKLELGRWFDDYMERVGGEYKNDQRGKLQFLGLVVALTLNVDSIHMAQVLFLDKDLRDQMVSEAERVSDSYVEQKKVAASDSLDVDAFLRSMGARHIDTILTDPVKIRVAQRDRRQPIRAL
ncbi:MAG: hypothetical protein IPL64_04185 [Flavobacteriales bacterium]|nr:hypothetical protein [Flavobacteriales bacterium]